LEASALSGQTPLLLASSFDFTWDFTLYSEGFLARNSEGNVEYISVDRQINQPVLDPDYISVKDYVEKKHNNFIFADNKITPILMAQKLEINGNKALELVSSIDVSKDINLMYEVADIKIWANLGLYFAAKTKGAIALQTYRKFGNDANKQAAIDQLQIALKYWENVVEISTPIYNDMPLVHLTEQKNLSKSEIEKLRFHWAIYRSEVVKDIEIAKSAVYSKVNSKSN
jgi:hypothetical protein